MLRSSSHRLWTSLLGSSLLLCGTLGALANDQKASNCPEPDFNAFLARFSREIAFQEKSVANPLEMAFVDATAEPEPKTVSKKVALKDVEWPVMTDVRTLSKTGRDMTVSDEPGEVKKVLIRKADTSDQQSYYFAQRPCWKLIKMFDESL